MLVCFKMRQDLYEVDALSDQNGHFNLPEIEPGKYILSIWHKSFGTLEDEIEILSGKTLNCSYLLEQN